MAVCQTCRSTPSYCGHRAPRHREPPLAAVASHCAPPEGRDAVYRDMLSLLSLEAHHRRQLRTRGLNDNEIARRGYRTLPLRGRARIARQLVSRFGEATCAQIPGLYMNDRYSSRYWSLAGASGLVVPVRDLQDRIVALKIRRDSDDIGSKYTTLTSARYNGPSPGSSAHVPLHDRIDYREVRITEGELKADIATTLTGTLTVGIPGVAMWRNALPVLSALKPAIVLLAFDADWRINPQVAKAMVACAMAIHKAGFEHVVEVWDLAHGKGIDDLLVTGGTPRLEDFGFLQGLWRKQQPGRNATTFRTIPVKEIRPWS